MPYFGKSLLGGLSAPVYWLYRLWCRSLRYTEINRATIENTADQGRPVVLSLWHDELFPLIYLKRQLNIIALVSQSDDGDLLAGVLERMGLETARGSSSRGGVKALLAAAHRMRESGICGCVTVDGRAARAMRSKKARYSSRHGQMRPSCPSVCSWSGVRSSKAGIASSFLCRSAGFRWCAPTLLR